MVIIEDIGQLKVSSESNMTLLIKTGLFWGGNSFVLPATVWLLAIEHHTSPLGKHPLNQTQKQSF